MGRVLPEWSKNTSNPLWYAHIVGRISVCFKTRLQVPDSRVRAWSQQSCLRRDKIQYLGKVLQNLPLTSHKMQLNHAILTMILPCQYLSWGTSIRNYLISAQNRSYSESPESTGTYYTSLERYFKREYNAVEIVANGSVVAEKIQEQLLQI